MTTLRRSLWAAALAFPLIAALLTACNGGDGDSAPTTPVAPDTSGVVAVRAYEWGFEPAAIAVHQGEPVRIVLTNDGDVLHDFKIEGLDADSIEIDNSGPLSGDEGELFVSADKDGSSSLSFIPAEPGTYTYYCTVRGHRRLGMEGSFIVR